MDLASLETLPIMRRCVAAGRALAGLQQAAALIPNQDVLINTIPLREAKDSSAIENIVTTTDNLFRFANTDAAHADDATKETLRYRTALMQGFKDIQERPLTTRTAVLVCRTISNVESMFDGPPVLPWLISRVARSSTHHPRGRPFFKIS
jgi:Fic family protein